MDIPKKVHNNICNSALNIAVQTEIVLTIWYTVGYATANDATTNECYNEQFLSIKSGFYNERGGILSADVARACGGRVVPSRFD
jgi:ammonia channel protein AmtB